MARRDEGRNGTRPGEPGAGGGKMLQAGAVIAVAAAAVSLVAGIGTYLYIRFTQHRTKPGGEGEERGPSPR